MPDGSLVSHISDTARWVAVYRARESQRADALFRDPYADRLAGERGRAIAAGLPRQARSGWPIVMRTRLIDDLVAACVEEGCDRVLNLAAGLDTRPYRMTLPQDLVWVEADLGPLIDEKERLLEGERAQCELRRERVDLADVGARSAFLDRATQGAKRTLVITEGLLTYFDDEVVRGLGESLAERPSIRWWVFEIISPAVIRGLQKGLGAHMRNSPLKFAPPNGIAFFERLGWSARDIRSVLREGVRLRRIPLLMRVLAMLPEANPRDPGDKRWSAVARLERASGQP